MDLLSCPNCGEVDRIIADPELSRNTYILPAIIEQESASSVII